MADRMYQNIRIGGDPGENRLNLMFMVAEAGFDEIVEDSDCLYCDAPEATPYDFDELKEYLRTIGLPYDHFFEASPRGKSSGGGPAWMTRNVATLCKQKTQPFRSTNWTRCSKPIGI